MVLVARGTSDNAALFGRYLLEITTGIPVSLAAPSIATLYRTRMDYRDALVVALSQSGESTDTNLVLERARRQGAITLGITNESASTLARIAEHVLLVKARREKSVAATKTTPARCSPCICWLTHSAAAYASRISMHPRRGRGGPGARSGDRRAQRPLPLHAPRRGGRARPQLFERV